MLRRFAFLVVCLMASIAAAQTPLTDLPLGDASAFGDETHIIVTGQPPEGRTDVDWAEDIARQNGMTVVAVWPLRSIDVICFVFAVSGEIDPVVDAVLTIEGVDTAYPIQTFETSTQIRYQDQYAQLQDGLSDMRIWSLHALTRGEGAVVALIDTAVSATHSDLAGQKITARNFVSREPVSALGETHGTAMAGIIAADARNQKGMVGVAPEAQLLALRACWETAGKAKGVCNTFSLARALNFAILNEADVINLSLTGPGDAILEQLIASAVRRNISVVLAHAPDAANAIGENMPGLVLASPNPGPQTIAMPGIDVLSAQPVDDYDFFSGASVSAAHASGGLALIRALYPAATVGELSAAFIKAGAGDQPVVNLCDVLNALKQEGARCH